MANAYLKYLRNELTDHLIYDHLARVERKPENKALLRKLADQERAHYKFWQSLAPDAEVTPHAIALFGIPFLCRLLGITFTVKFLELHEEKMVAEYKAAIPTIPPDRRAELVKIIDEEKVEEKELIGRLREKRVSYIGFVALGLADAIVEITGVHAGFLGVTGSTLLAGISGVIVGFAAAISMGSAAYLQAKQDPEGKPGISALITGTSYIFAVICLALPYFLIRVMLPAFVTSAVIGVVILAGFNFYGSVVFDKKFLREFTESTALMLGTALATYILGKTVGAVFHINGSSF